MTLGLRVRLRHSDNPSRRVVLHYTPSPCQPVPACLPACLPPSQHSSESVSESVPKWLRLLLRGRPRPHHRRRLPPSRGQGSGPSPTPRTAPGSPRTPRGGPKRSGLQVRFPAGIKSKVGFCLGGRNTRWRPDHLASGF